MIIKYVPDIHVSIDYRCLFQGSLQTGISTKPIHAHVQELATGEIISVATGSFIQVLHHLLPPNALLDYDGQRINHALVCTIS